jgi:hypothetical protein
MASVVVNAQEPRAGQIVIEPYTFRTYDGREHPAELGRLLVRENRNGDSGRLIQLAFVRLRSTAAQPSVMERLERNPVPITVTDRRTNRQVSLRVAPHQRIHVGNDSANGVKQRRENRESSRAHNITSAPSLYFC